MDRRPCMSLLFGPVEVQRATERGGHYQCGAGWVVRMRSGWVLPRRGSGGRSRDGPGGFYRRGVSVFYRGGLLLMIVLSLAPRPFCETGTIIKCEKYN